MCCKNNLFQLQVKLKNGSPVPPVHVSWEQYADEDARSWLGPYIGRIQLWNGIVPNPIPYMGPTDCISLG